jgi:uncharacterized protein (TIGR03067 family)
MKKHVCLSTVLLILTASYSPSADPDKADAAAKDLAEMQGKWQIVEDETNGEALKGEGAVILIEKEFIIGLDGDGKPESKSSIKLDPSKSPKEMDQTFIFLRGIPKAKGTLYQSIYQLEKDMLKIATTVAPYRGRPEEFTTKKGSHFIVLTYKRMKP